MKIYLIGKGHRLENIRDALGMSRLEAVQVADEPARVRFGPPDRVLSTGDLIIVSETEEPALRAMLDNLARQKLPVPVMVFTSLSSRPLARDYPSFLFRDDRLIYRNELRELQRRAAGQQKVESIRRAVRGSPLLILIWGNPDPDAIASSYAFQELVRESAAASQIAYLGEFTRPENSAMVNILKIPMRKFVPELLTDATTVAILDAQPSFFQLDGRLRFDIIIDHHPLTDLGAHRFADVRPTYGSTSTILTEYFQTSGARMNRKIATALFYGLKVDTGNLTRNVSDADVAAFRYLRVRADENMVRTIELSQLPLETLDYFSLAFARRRIAGDVAFAWLGTIPNADMCVHVADFFIKFTGISWAVVACRSRDRVVAVFRSDGFRKHAGRLAETLFLEYGSAGGHRTMARAEMPVERLAVEIPDPTDDALGAWVLRRLAARLKTLAR